MKIFRVALNKLRIHITENPSKGFRIFTTFNICMISVRISKVLSVFFDSFNFFSFYAYPCKQTNNKSHFKPEQSIEEVLEIYFFRKVLNSH